MSSIACPGCGKLNSALRLQCYVCGTVFEKEQEGCRDKLTLPSDTLQKLHRRSILVAEVPMQDAEMRAYVVVIPQIASPEPTTHNLSPVIGYEVRYLRHLARFTEEAVGYSYNIALRDKATQLKRVFVVRQENEEALQKALLRWLTDLTTFQRPLAFDSALVKSYYFDRPEDLWKE